MAITLKRATVSVELCTDMDLNAEHEALSEQLLDRAKKGVKDDRITGDPVAARIAEIEKLMQADVVLFTLRALPRKRWVELTEAHPPREGDETDTAYGVNVATFIDAAMPEAVESVVQKESGDAVLWTPSDWATLADDMSDGQWQAFALRLMQLNQSRVAVPFNRAASRKIETSGDN